LSFEEKIEAWPQLIPRILLQIAVGFGVGLIAAFAALLASAYEPDLPLSGFVVLSPTWLVPIAALALANLWRIARARPSFNVALFLAAALAGEVAVVFAISAAAAHG
jgi:hypothetical protein